MAATYILSVKTHSTEHRSCVTVLVEDENHRRREYARVFSRLSGEEPRHLEQRLQMFVSAAQSGPFGNSGPTYLPNFEALTTEFDKVADELEATAREEIDSREQAAVTDPPYPLPAETVTKPVEAPLTEDEEKMTDESKLKKVGGEVLDASKIAAGLAAAAKTRRAAVDLMLAGAVRANVITAEQAEDDRIKMAVGVMLPGLIMIAAEYAPNSIPKTDAVAVGAKYALIGAQADVMDVVLPEILPLVEMFAAMAMSNFADEIAAHATPAKELEGTPNPSVADVLSPETSARTTVGVAR